MGRSVHGVKFSHDDGMIYHGGIPFSPAFVVIFSLKSRELLVAWEGGSRCKTRNWL